MSITPQIVRRPRSVIVAHRPYVMYTRSGGPAFRLASDEVRQILDMDADADADEITVSADCLTIRSRTGRRTVIKIIPATLGGGPSFEYTP